MLAIVFDLREEIVSFLSFKNKRCPDLANPEWVSDLGFCADLFVHLNELTLQLQGKGLLVTELNLGLYCYKISFLDTQG